jgi:hypothetical protein
MTTLARGLILRKYLWISIEIATCESKNQFFRKLCENY